MLREVEGMSCGEVKYGGTRRHAKELGLYTESYGGALKGFYVRKWYNWIYVFEC